MHILSGFVANRSLFAFKHDQIRIVLSRAFLRGMLSCCDLISVRNTFMKSDSTESETVSTELMLVPLKDRVPNDEIRKDFQQAASALMESTADQRGRT